jgi:FKBP-type peptidyl-prolyl cis-trans isomerase FkpA
LRTLLCAATLALAGLLGLGGCGTGSEPEPAPPGVDRMEITDLVVGNGPAAAPGSYVNVHYTGWIYDPAAPESKGRQFDTSRERGRVFGFSLGARQVIAGWDQGVVGMRVGGVRRLVIPPQLAYGERGAGGGVIPRNATLVFEVELVDLR